MSIERRSGDVLDVADLAVAIPVAEGLLHPVRGVDLAIARGDSLCIVGESGSGKSLTALALMNLLPPRARRSAKALRLLGEELALAPEQRMQALRGDRMAMIFQEPMTALNPAYTVGEQMVEGLLHHRPGTTRAQAVRRAVELLETCGIAQAKLRLRQYPHQLSGGLRQRVMIAMALMSEPALLIADEPTTALDVTIQAQILALLARLQREFHLAIILITHDLGVVRRFGHRVAVMYAGEIVESQPTEALFRAPLHPYTRALLACSPTAAERARPGGRLGFLPGTPPHLVGALAGCQFRHRCSLAQAECAGPVPIHALAEGFYRCTIGPAAARVEATRAVAEALTLRPAAQADLAVEIAGAAVGYRVSAGLFAAKRVLHALRGVDLAVRRGEVLGIVGESGCGKSTLARVMLGLERQSAGAVRILGRDVGDYRRRELARAIQPVFQDPYSSLNPRKTVETIIRTPLDVHGLGDGPEGRGAARRTEVRRMMGLCGLPARLARAYPSQLSGGQRQRVAIASALVMRPAIVVCDEPTSALDVSVQSQILNLLMDLRAELGLTYVVISHDLAVIRHLAERIAVMYLGKIVEEGPAADILAAPKHPYAQMLLDASIAPTRSATVQFADAEKTADYPNPLAPPAGCGFHPRCPHAMDRCRSEAPALKEIAPRRRAACHLNDASAA
jgi:peptide/nickel transport system ATP-binding protein